MRRPAKLSREQIDATLARHAERWSQARIATWLKKSFGVTISQQSVGEYIRRELGERARLIPAGVVRAIADHVADALPADLRRLDLKIRRCNRIARLAHEAGQPHVELKALEQQRKLIETRQRFAGGDRAAEDTIVENVADLLGLALNDEDQAARAAAGDPVARRAQVKKWSTNIRSDLDRLLSFLDDEHPAREVLNATRAALDSILQRRDNDAADTAA